MSCGFWNVQSYPVLATPLLRMPLPFSPPLSNLCFHLVRNFMWFNYLIIVFFRFLLLITLKLHGICS